jgi:SAM-dependent methyltransferase
VFIEQFLSAHAGSIRGDVLEVKDSGVTDRLGTGVTGRHVLDIDPANPHATVVADLGERGSLPAGSFDCFILSQTLQYVGDVHVALANAYGALRPGGTLLVTVPTIARVDPDLRDVDRWRLTARGLADSLRAACPDGEISVSAKGNLVTTLAFLLGLAAEELRPRELEMDDEDHALLACAAVRRPPVA